MTRIIFTLLAMITCSLAQAAKDEVVFGFNPAENVEVVEAKSQQFKEYYKQKTGKNVKTFIATDYTALIEALRSGRVDFAFLPPFSLVKAEEIANAQVLLKSVRKGREYFYSAIIVRADKGYNKIEDLKGKNMAWVDPSSTSGHIFPKANLMSRKKINADNFFGKQIFAGAHDSLVLAVLNGTVDAGATFVNDKEGTDGAWHQFLKGDDSKKIKAIFITDPIPADTMATSKKLMQADKKLVDDTVKILLEMGKDENGKKILTSLYRIDGLVKAQSKDFEPVRKAAKSLDLMK